MKIITCIKQVPASSDVKVDEKTGVLIRDGQNVKMNPYDLFALETAFTIEAMHRDASVHAVTMGPPSAIKVLNEALYMGSKEATLISDRRFAGADVLATAYTLSQLIRHISNFDIIICGKQTTDGDTAQVGPEIAEFLDIPHVSYVKEIIKIEPQMITVLSSYDQYEEVVQVKLPCLLTVDKSSHVPRLPSYKRKLLYKDYQPQIVTLSDLKDTNPYHYGLNGSPTQVLEIFPPDKNNQAIKIDGKKEILAQKLFDILKESKFI